MTPASFADAVLSYARQVQAATGIDAWALVTQWALETGNGTSALYVSGHNAAGITGPDPHTGETVFLTFPDLAAFTTACIATWGLPYYTGVRAVTGEGTLATLWAMGQSPWDAGHYGSPPGQHLVDLWQGTYAAVAGSTTGGPQPASLYAALFVSIVSLARAVGASVPLPDWAAAQHLTADHLGTPYDLASGANYLAGLLYGLAGHIAPGRAFSAPPAAPQGASDPASVLAGCYVALVDCATALGTGVLGVPWAAAQGLTVDHLGHPPSLDAGVSYLQGQIDGLTAHLVTGTPVSAPPAGTGGNAYGGGGTWSPSSGPTSSAGAGIAPPYTPPPADPGPGMSGLLSAWDILRTTLNTTLPALANRAQGASAVIGSGTGNRAKPV